MGEANGAGEVKESRARRDELLAIQQEAQRRWVEDKVFEVDAPATGAQAEKKYTANFPYPYMNGVLHVGHAFSLSKVEFATAYHRLCGERVLFPQGFHCTGMPILASANKLKAEIEQYGLPPVFPEEEGDGEGEAEVKQESDPTKFSGRHSKAAAKQGKSKWQWDILKSSGVSESEIPRFRDPAHWLVYFPPIAIQDISAMGCGIDWRRSFITTDVNPYYDSFVRWQFNTLHKQGKITKAKRYSVYSPKDGQPCADHDRASGEAVNPQEYTLVKLQAMELNGKLKELEGKGPVYLMAATLRPETMAGQTNCWVLPEGLYGAYKALNGEIFVMSPRSARNLSFQDRTPKPGEAELLLELTGQDLIGTPLKAPCCSFERVYVLPLLTILMNKGTGIVTSVPSDSPDDYAALMDLKKKPKLREKFGVKDEWVVPFELVPIIDIPGFGNRAAEKVCVDLKIQSQNDSKKLEEAKKAVYLKGFTDGIMLVGKYKGEKVNQCKDKHRADLLDAGDATLYSEPEHQVISRSGDECVVALTDQWYLKYGESSWLDSVRKELDQMNLYGSDARKQFNNVLEWLHEWACSRSHGLGTKLPWDPVFLIESLSDSTIYMAYYTVAHILQAGDIYGKSGGKIKAEDVTDAVWDYVFLDGKLPQECNIPRDLLQKMRQEFEYWYPFDLRASGKDLIPNHLTFCLYTHAAIWHDRPDMWPRSFRCNGHLLLNNKKMSKSTGNFMTLAEAIKKFGADAMRVAMADAGDLMDDANFVDEVANSAILRLTKELAWIKEVLEALPSLRKGQTVFADRVFANEINSTIHKTHKAYEALMFREALSYGCYELQKARDAYRLAVGPEGMEFDLIQRYLEVSTLLLAPLCPHTCHHIWSNLLRKPGYVMSAGWPQAAEPDTGLKRMAAYVDRLKDRLGVAITKGQQPKKQKKAEGTGKVVRVNLYVARTYKPLHATILQYLQSKYDDQAKAFQPDTMGLSVVEAVKAAGSWEGMPEKTLTKHCIAFARAKCDETLLSGPESLSVDLPFDEAAVIEENVEFLQRSLKLESVAVHEASEAAATERSEVAKAEPGQPAIVLLKQ